jgi:xylulokinase
VALVLGVDSSTSATKVEVRDTQDGRVVARGRAPHPPTSAPRSEQQPASWWDAFEIAFARAGRPVVGAVAVAAQQHGLVVLDARDRVVRPAKLWNDTESAADAERLVGRLGPEAWAAACGSVPVASFTITKLSWLHRCEPHSFGLIARLMLAHDWLTFRLCRERVTDRGDASGTGYWSPAEGRWRPDLLALVDEATDWEAALPTVLGPRSAAGEWQGAVVAPGTGDNMAAALGLGLGPGDVALSLGTSGTAFAVADSPSADPTGAVAGFADATGRFLPLVCTLNATRVTDAVARLLGVGVAALDALAAAAPPGSGGVVLVPYLDGERTPDRPGATGVLSGLRSDVQREQLARSAFEGVVCGLLEGLDHLGPAADGRLFLVGGGARSGLYRQVVADLSGRAVTVPAGVEHVAAGACVQAAAVLEGRPPEEVAAAWGLGSGTVVEPDGRVDRDGIRARYGAAAAAAWPGGTGEAPPGVGVDGTG